MEGELYNFAKVWFIIFISLFYCFTIGNLIPKGGKRLFFLLPIIFLFLLLPLNLNSPHLCGMTSFFISWLANFKLLLFSFGKGPLNSDSSISFPWFLLNCCFPIKTQQYSPQKSHTYEKSPKSFSNYAIKSLLLAILIRLYDYHDHFHPKVVMILYCFHIYFFLEIILAVIAAAAQSVLGLELEPQFNDPYLSTSLQDFWGRRWNIMVTSILRPTVYDPIRKTCSPIIGPKWAPLPAIFGTFIVSAIMHELVFYHLGRLNPTWEITLFFIVHGVCLVTEVGLKKLINGRLKVPRFISTVLTIGFVMVTGFWLFFPYLFLCKVDVRAFEEYAALGQFFKHYVGLGFEFCGRYSLVNLSS
ncbi:acyl-CoA--sterol O-acyltransferase 1-like [Mercurialis annua]|uniref:acyl-CoA--sterol O-acyltransferase 1-like n=1 Tax=Mercurialis annua TaxID=3986 RepID=UPI00215E4690|nr:acyl-CoA--sterol O-acyltransferase 1-like [Mercurialis annua]